MARKPGFAGAAPGLARRLSTGALALAASFVAWKCAHIEPPSGGPVDTQAPRVLAVYPAPGARNVPLDAPVVFQFSEWIDRTAARNQAFVSPPVRGRLQVAAEGNKLQVRPSEAAGGWRANTSYQVTVLPSLQDLHGVRAGKPFVLRFSTGAEVDVGSLSGTVLSADPKGNRMVALYRAGNRASVEPLSAREENFQPGSLPEPWRELPAFLALADSLGRFRFDSVAQGEYSLLAFEDVNGNFTYDFGFENAAPGTLSLALRPRAEEQVLRTAPADTLPLRIVKADFVADAAPDSAAAPAGVPGRVRLEFSRPPHPARAAEPGRYRILPAGAAADPAGSLPVSAAGWSALDEAWMLETPPLRAGAYRVEMRGRPDYPGRDPRNLPDTSVSFTVGSASSDTAAWKFSFIQASALTSLPRLLTWAPPGTGFTVASNLPLTPSRWKTLTERLETRVDTLTQLHEITIVNNFTFSLQLKKAPPRGARLELRLRPAPGDSAARSLASLSFLDSATVGSVRFTPPARWAGWTFRLDEGGRESYPAPSAEIPAGRYRLFAFRDDDRDGLWNPGYLKPWIPQEPHALALDSVEVKAGVTTDLTGPLEKARP
ncbi:MAG: putative lipoprotein [Fibrobacteria bacterium]|jgi:hypothetical protein|nr:putative lipoprotein [Fibrobacteria bacterium]